MMCTLVLADELLGTGVQINSLCPGEIFSTNISRHLSDCERWVSLTCAHFLYTHSVVIWGPGLHNYVIDQFLCLTLLQLHNLNLIRPIIK